MTPDSPVSRGGSTLAGHKVVVLAVSEPAYFTDVEPERQTAIPDQPPELRDRVFFIAGGTCGGKSTVADILAQRLGWSAYHLDEHVWDMQKLATADTAPTCCYFRDAPMGEWFDRTPQESLDLTYRLSNEVMPPAYRQIAKLSGCVIAEGAYFYPQMLLRDGWNPEKIAVVKPTHQFRLRPIDRTGHSWKTSSQHTPTKTPRGTPGWSVIASKTTTSRAWLRNTLSPSWRSTERSHQ